MKKLMTICLAATMILAIGSVANASWNPGDPSKWVQLPDPNGWDVAFDDYASPGHQYPLADDWQCTETGPVKDIHLWLSWQGDRDSYISQLHVAIYGDHPDDPENQNDYSTPDGTPTTEPLWSRLLYPDMIEYGTGDQGWFSPFVSSSILLNDHDDIYQLNITNITTPFEQVEGNTYWLVVNAWWGKVDPYNPEWPGWKTSQDHWNDAAVYWDGSNWQKLTDPLTSASLDMAFVLTPEPATVCLLGLGALSLIRRKRGA